MGRSCVGNLTCLIWSTTHPFFLSVSFVFISFIFGFTQFLSASRGTNVGFLYEGTCLEPVVGSDQGAMQGNFWTTRKLRLNQENLQHQITNLCSNSKSSFRLEHAALSAALGYVFHWRTHSTCTRYAYACLGKGIPWEENHLWCGRILPAYCRSPVLSWKERPSPRVACCGGGHKTECDAKLTTLWTKGFRKTVLKGPLWKSKPHVWNRCKACKPNGAF